MKRSGAAVKKSGDFPEPSTMKDLRYPIGRFEHSGLVSGRDLSTWIGQIEVLPEQLRQVVVRLSDEQVDTVYRPGGWTIRQVVHHLADSHTNCYVRFKWALTEEEPTIKTYDERRWAELVDYRLVPVQTSLDFLSLLHERWVVLLRALTPDQLSRRFVHPESGPSELAWNVGNYAWHGRHHLAHITGTVEREGWNVSV